jgi:hypothetical protein
LFFSTNAAGHSQGQTAGVLVTWRQISPSVAIMSSNALATANELLAGSIAGAAQVLVGQPLDTVKTRAQIAPSNDSTHDEK